MYEEYWIVDLQQQGFPTEFKMIIEKGRDIKQVFREYIEQHVDDNIDIEYDNARVIIPYSRVAQDMLGNGNRTIYQLVRTYTERPADMTVECVVLFD